VGKLPVLQKCFDARLAKLLEPSSVAEISQRESKIFPRLWALWFLFARSPERRITFAETRALSEFEARRDAFLIGLKQELAGLGEVDGNPQASIAFEGDNLKRFLVVELRLGTIFELETGRQVIFESLDRVFANTAVGTFDAYAREYFWSQIFIVPTLRGMTLGQRVYIIPTFTFSGIQSSCDRPWTRVPQINGELSLVGLGFKTGDQTRDLGEMQVFESALAEIAFLFSHISQFSELTDLDEVGEAILQDYFRTLSPALEARLNDVINTLPDILLQFQGEFQGQPLAMALAANLRNLLDDLQSPTGDISFSPVASATQAQKYLEASSFLFILRWARPEDFEQLTSGFGQE